MTNPNPLAQLNLLGQSVWYDFIRRDLVSDGTLERLIAQDSLGGMTTNPAIFAAAIGGSSLYDDDIIAAKPEDSAETILRTLAIADVQRAADLFRPVYDATGSKDGFVSIEVDPRLAYDATATIAEAQQLWELCDRPNVMIKIPGTEEGLVAIEQTLAAGINVNVTLLFSVERYRQVMDRYLSAIKTRKSQGLPVDRLASVASFFISRVDTLLDPILRERAKSDESEEKRQVALELISTLGIANAKLAYAAFEKRFTDPDALELVEGGAQLQRPLWASTSTKDPNLSEIIYVENLVGTNTVNTMPPVTYDAYRKTGKPEMVLGGWFPKDAAKAVENLEWLGISFAAVTHQLEMEGTRKFVDAHLHLLNVITEKRTLRL